MTQAAPIPVTVLSGFLGAGKTTLLNQILSDPGENKVAVIVNDFSELNIDARLIEQGMSVTRQQENLAELSNGCICCTLREDLLTEVKSLAEKGSFDRIIIESTGVSEPEPVAETFYFVDEQGFSLADYVKLDAMITVVDSVNFLKELDAADDLAERELAVDEEDQRTIADLLIEQVEFADILLLNKTDLVSESEKRQLKSLLERFNPTAKILESSFAKIPTKKILDTQLFDYEKSFANKSRFDIDLKSDGSESEELSTSSFVYRSRRPFHPERLWQLFNVRWPGVVRSKGMFWVASRPEDIGVWSQAGGACSAHFQGKWLASLPKEEWEFETPEDIKQFEQEWDARFGDRMQEIVLIGQDMQREDISQLLDGCLLTDKELEKGSYYWRRQPDHFAGDEIS